MPEHTQRTDRPALMRHNQKLTYADLLKEAQEAAATYRGTQAQLATELGVTPGALSQALNTEGGRFIKLQVRVIEKLTDYQIEEEPVVVTFRAVKRSA